LLEKFRLFFEHRKIPAINKDVGLKALMSWLSGNSLNDIILLEREIEKTKAFQTFIKERGEVELINSYLTTTIFTYN
jgi:hypothetical protein